MTREVFRCKCMFPILPCHVTSSGPPPESVERWATGLWVDGCSLPSVSGGAAAVPVMSTALSVVAPAGKDVHYLCLFPLH